MNIYKALNEITLYIDEHLEEKIDYEKLAKILGVNSYTMQRLFSLITGYPLAEYIRKRRLSRAGEDLLTTNVKIIDLAIKYNYENATSFSRAFESFHNIKPSKVTKESIMQSFPRIIFNENIKINTNIEYQVIEKEEMTLYGKGIKTNKIEIKKDAPNFFKEIELKYHKKYGDIKYGMVTYTNKYREECNGYYCLYDVKIPEFEKIIIPKSKWLVFKIDNQETVNIQELSQQFYLSFFPSCKYNFRELPELEYYHDGITEFLVPII